MYQSMLKRAAFVAGAILIGIVGNWIRAYLTIIIAHFTDNRLLRDDHSTFGWILFAIFLLLYFSAGWAWRDKAAVGARKGVDVTTNGAKNFTMKTQSEISASLSYSLSAVVFATLIVWPILEKQLSVPQQLQPLGIINIEAQSGWSKVGKPAVEWTPELQNPSLVSKLAFEKAGSSVGVVIGIFRNQTWDSKLVTVTNQLAESDKHAFTLVDRNETLTTISSKPLNVKTGVVLGHSSRILVWHWYSVNGLSTGSDISAKIYQFMARLHGRADAGAWVALYSDARVSPEIASNVHKEFLQDMGGSLERTIAQMTSH